MSSRRRAEFGLVLLIRPTVLPLRSGVRRAVRETDLAGDFPLGSINAGLIVTSFELSGSYATPAVNRGMIGMMLTPRPTAKFRQGETQVDPRPRATPHLDPAAIPDEGGLDRRRPPKNTLSNVRREQKKSAIRTR